MSVMFPQTSERKSRRSQVVSVIAVATLLFLTGCASVGAPQQSQTLPAFEQLTVQPDGSRAWRDDQAGRYEAVRIDPSAITFSADIQIDEEQRNELRNALSLALTEKFSLAGMQPANAIKRRGTLVVRGTVTAVDLASPALNVVTTVFLLAPLSRGGMTVELEAIDAESGKRVAALVFKGTAGLENITSAYSAIGHAKLQANVVAERFVQLSAGSTTVGTAAR
jgi:Protein of unknown function (DUF3313)